MTLWRMDRCDVCGMDSGITGGAVSIVSFVVMDENECRNVTRLSRLLLHATC